VFWVISVYCNLRTTLPKSGTFLLGHPVYNVYCVCSAVLVTRTRLNITLYVRCLSLISTSFHAERVASFRPVDIRAKHIRTRHCAPNNFVVCGTECPQHRRNNCDVWNTFERILFRCNLGLRTEPEEISSKDCKYCSVGFFVGFGVFKRNLDR
jgi:hypothetical protein